MKHNRHVRRWRKDAGPDDAAADDRRRPRRIYAVGTEPDPRFTMANERTLLAWLRTALAFVVTGIAATALQAHVARPAFIGIVAGGACLTGTIAAIAAYGRWQRVELSLRLQRPLPDPRAAGLLIVALMVLAAAGVVTLIWDAL
ncbi:YidH family protein [Pseudonocardia hispaniensis]|uniref:YidH family protein n=1 Tax=Pseudonocardia hispaniensis TaxID=904933 RepID=A0ABW1J7A7_9PSEU